MTIPQLTVPGAGRPQPPDRVPEPLQWPLPLLLEKLERFRSEVRRYADDGDARTGRRVNGLDRRLLSLEAMFPPDATLSLAGRPADAEATGNNIRALRLAQSGFVSHSEGTDMTLALMGYYDGAGQHFYHSRGHQPNPDGALYVLHPWLMEQYMDGGGVARTRRKQWDRMRGCLYVDMETNRTYAWRGPDGCADVDLAAQGAGYVALTEDYFDGASYDSAAKKIQLKHGDAVKAEIDATAFIKDGMVSSVAISGGNLVITFNTDAGKEPISIPITDIFNPASYYDKTEADGRFAPAGYAPAVLGGSVRQGASSNSASGRYTGYVAVDVAARSVTLEGEVSGIQAGWVASATGDTTELFQNGATVHENFSMFGKVESVSVAEGRTVVTFDVLWPGAKFDATPGEQYWLWFPDHPDAGLHDVAYAHAEGRGENAATMLGAHAEGYKANAVGKQAHAEGQETYAGYSAHAEGRETVARGNWSHAEGFGSETGVTARYAHAEGIFIEAAKRASGDPAVAAQAVPTRATGDGAHAEGEGTLASGEAAHSEGYATTASSKAAHSEGNGTTASQPFAHAEGVNTIASGEGAHAEGEGTTGRGASGRCSHSEGYQTTASGNYSHAEGYQSTAEGNQSHAEGNGCQALSHTSKASGYRARVRGSSADRYQDIYSFTWNGDDNGSYWAANSKNAATGFYESHGRGTFNVNPRWTDATRKWLDSFYIGEHKFDEAVAFALSMLPSAGRTAALSALGGASASDLRYAIVTLTPDASGKVVLQDRASNVVTPVVTPRYSWVWSDGGNYGAPTCSGVTFDIVAVEDDPDSPPPDPFTPGGAIVTVAKDGVTLGTLKYTCQDYDSYYYSSGSIPYGGNNYIGNEESSVSLSVGGTLELTYNGGDPFWSAPSAMWEAYANWMSTGLIDIPVSEAGSDPSSLSWGFEADFGQSVRVSAVRPDPDVAGDLYVDFVASGTAGVSWAENVKFVYDSGSGYYYQDGSVTVDGFYWYCYDSLQSIAVDDEMYFGTWDSRTVTATKTTVYDSTVSTITLPAEVPGKVRDFIVRIDMSAVPSVPNLSWAAPTGETASFETESGDFPELDKARNLISFTETAEHTFAVAHKVVKPVTAGGAS